MLTMNVDQYTTQMALRGVTVPHPTRAERRATDPTVRQHRALHRVQRCLAAHGCSRCHADCTMMQEVY